MKKVMKVIAMILVVIGVIFALIESEKIDCEKYNHGICANCGGHYRLVSCSHQHLSYTYECDNCYKTIITGTRMN